MKSLIRKIAQKLLKPFALKVGYTLKNDEINQGDKNELLDTFFGVLKNINFTPLHIIDIGANHGTWTRKALQHFPHAYFTLLEPQAWLKESIKELLEKNSKITFHGVGAGEKQGSFKFTIVDRDDSCCFGYSEQESLANGFRQIDIPVVTINGLLEDKEVPIPDIIKIDAEGMDIEVLKGASNYYGKTEIFMVETSVMNKKFSNNLSAMIHFMDSIGYKFFDITDLNRTMQHNALWLIELVFIKKGGYIDDSITFY